MEKFGIFELLDTLSALTAQKLPEAEKTPAQDSAYLPPVYGAPQPNAQTAASGSPQKDAPQPESKSQPHAESDALLGFYARHEAVARKASKKQ